MLLSPAYWRSGLIGAILLGILLFLPAQTLAYWQAWVFMAVFIIATNAIGVYLSLQNPALLERRLKFGPAQESNPPQKAITSLILLGSVALLVVPALDHRLGWSRAPAGVSLLGDGLVVLGLYINYLVMTENSFSGSTVETFAGQQVISTGLYARIRHPMYAGALVMCAGVPLALGSYWGLAVLALVLPVLVWRILDEEALLKKELPGYAAYARRVRYRLVPHLW